MQFHFSVTAVGATDKALRLARATVALRRGKAIASVLPTCCGGVSETRACRIWASLRTTSSHIRGHHDRSPKVGRGMHWERGGGLGVGG